MGQREAMHQARVTRPREFVRQGGTRETVVDQVTAEGEDLAIVDKAVAAFVKKSGMVFHDTRKSRDPKDPGKTVWSPFSRALEPKDILAATLKRHETTGEAVGRELDEPFVSLITGESRRYHVSVKGEIAGTCKLCEDAYDPITEVNGKLVHEVCFRSEVRRRERAQSLGQTTADAVAASL